MCHFKLWGRHFTTTLNFNMTRTTLLNLYKNSILAKICFMLIIKSFTNLISILFYILIIFCDFYFFVLTIDFRFWHCAACRVFDLSFLIRIWYFLIQFFFITLEHIQFVNYSVSDKQESVADKSSAMSSGFEPSDEKCSFISKAKPSYLKEMKDPGEYFFFFLIDIFSIEQIYHIEMNKI